MSTQQLSIAITGAGGAGVISCGELLLQAWARDGGRGLLFDLDGVLIDSLASIHACFNHALRRLLK